MSGARGRALGATLGLAVCLGLAPPGAAAQLIEAVVAVVGDTPVTAGEVALARALGLFGFTPAVGPIAADDVERMIRARLVLAEAARLGIEPDPGELDAAWRRLAERAGGLGALASWLAAEAVEEAWARRLVADDRRHARFVELRFRAFVFVTEAEVAAALGPGTHAPAARDEARERLRSALAARRLDEWLRDAVQRVRLWRGLGPEATISLDWPARPLLRGAPD
jgi:hypothetical protein